MRCTVHASSNSRTRQSQSMTPRWRPSRRGARPVCRHIRTIGPALSPLVIGAEGASGTTGSLFPKFDPRPRSSRDRASWFGVDLADRCVDVRAHRTNPAQRKRLFGTECGIGCRDTAHAWVRGKPTHSRKDFCRSGITRNARTPKQRLCGGRMPYPCGLVHPATTRILIVKHTLRQHIFQDLRPPTSHPRSTLAPKESLNKSLL